MPKFVVAAFIEVGRDSRIASSDLLVSTPVDGGADGVNTSAPLPQTPADVHWNVAALPTSEVTVTVVSEERR
jgi:hypothetical protein